MWEDEQGGGMAEETPAANAPGAALALLRTASAGQQPREQTAAANGCGKPTHRVLKAHATRTPPGVRATPQHETKANIAPQGVAASGEVAPQASSAAAGALEDMFSALREELCQYLQTYLASVVQQSTSLLPKGRAVHCTPKIVAP